MRCPLCAQAGNEHELMIDGNPARNLRQVTEYWDRDNKFHAHDRQRRGMNLRCSNGHAFTITFLSKCPRVDCEWNQQPETHAGTGWPEPAKTE